MKRDSLIFSSLLKAVMLLVICFCFTGFAQVKWWNNQWNFRAFIPGDIKPVLKNICAAKIDFTSLISSVSNTNNKFELSSIRVIGLKKDGSFSELRFNFIPHTNFDSEKNAKGIILWEKAEDVESYWVYFDVQGQKGKPVSSYKADIDINLLPEGSLDKGIEKFRTFGEVVFDADEGFLKKGSVKLKKKKDEQPSYIFSQFLDAEPDTEYDLSFFGKSDAKEMDKFSLVAYVNFYDENNKYIDRKGERLETRGKFDWTPYTMTAKTPAKTKKIAIHISTHQETGYVWLDDIRITPVVSYMVKDVEVQTGKKVNSVVESKIPFDFVEIRYPDFYKPEAAVEPEEQKIGFYLWETRPEVVIYYYTKAPVVRKREIKAWGSLGERVTRSFCIRPFNDFGRINMEVTGEIKDIVEVREMMYLPVRHIGKTYHIVPVYLDRISGQIEKGKTTQYYLTFSIPENSKPGIYSGSLKITASTKAGQSVSFAMPISLRVLPFKLQKPEDVYWGFSYGNYDWNAAYGAPSEKKVFYPEQEPLMFENMRKHNANMVSLSGCLPVYEKKDGRYVFDFTKVTKAGRANLSLKETLDNALKAGFKCILINSPNEAYHGGFFDVPVMSEQWQNLCVQMIQDTISFVHNNKYPFRIYFLLVDEPANSKKLTEDAITLSKLVKSKIKDVKIYETLHTLTLPTIGPLIDAVMMFAGELNENTIEATKNMGKELWSDNGGSFRWDYSIDRFYTGFYNYRIGGKGILQWAYMWPRGPDAYDDFNPKNRAGGHAGYFYAYPSPEGPKDTPGIEGFGDGIYDYMYLYTLEKTIEQIKKTGNKEKIKEAEACWQEIKKEILDTIPLQYKYDFVKAEDFQPDKMEAWRWKIAQKILQLKGEK